MTTYTVNKILQHGTRQLLLVQAAGDMAFQLSVYDEHTGTTLMRMTQCTIEHMLEAIALLQAS